MSVAIQAIETRYKGYRFRSRLEARWAVFFDTLGVEFNYEFEGYRLGTIDYLPDFYLPQVPCFFEVKGRELSADDELKVSQLAIRSGVPVYVAIGEIPEPESGFPQGRWTYTRDGSIGLHQWTKDGLNCYWHFLKCAKCGTFSVIWENTWKKNCDCLNWFLFDDDHKDECIDNHNQTGRLMARAYAAARSARFEHGERA